MLTREVPINAVLDRNLRSLITGLDLQEGLDRGALRCPECGKPIRFENIGAIKILDGVAVLICDDYACIVENE